MPYTLYPIPYTLYPTPYTLHPISCTLHPYLCKPVTHLWPYALPPGPYALPSRPYALPSGLYALPPGPYLTPGARTRASACPRTGWAAGSQDAWTAAGSQPCVLGFREECFDERVRALMYKGKYSPLWLASFPTFCVPEHIYKQLVCISTKVKLIFLGKYFIWPPRKCFFLFSKNESLEQNKIKK
jgi:hypothetical protein